MGVAVGSNFDDGNVGDGNVSDGELNRGHLGDVLYVVLCCVLCEDFR